MSLLSDDRLARRATQGDQRAFEAIYRRYQQDLYRFCLAMIGDPQDAQDAFQNAMLKVLKALPGEERQIKLKPWLYRIARNEAVEILRRRRDHTELEPDTAPASTETVQAVEGREQLRILLADLEQLPHRQRAALVMRELSGLDFTQIGEAFGSSTGVARQTLYEARLSLRQMEEGREMRCEAVMRALSDADGRVIRRRGLRAHLRGCSSCRAFRDSISKRHDELAAIAPLPAALSAGLLQGLIGGQASTTGVASGAGAAGVAGAGGAGPGGAIGAGAGKIVATSAIVKSAATVAVVATVGVSVGDRSGLIDLPFPGGHGTSTESESKPGISSQPGRREGTAAERSGPAEGALEVTSREQVQSTPSHPAGLQGDLEAPETSAADNSKSSGASGSFGDPSTSGRPPSRTHGKPQGAPGRGKPSGNSHGQEVSAAHKSPHANPSPGKGSKSHGESTSPNPTGPPPQAKDPPAKPIPPQPPPNAGGAASKGSGKDQAEAPEP